MILLAALRAMLSVSHNKQCHNTNGIKFQIWAGTDTFGVFMRIKISIPCSRLQKHAVTHSNNYGQSMAVSFTCRIKKWFMSVMSIHVKKMQCGLLTNLTGFQIVGNKKQLAFLFTPFLFSV